MSTLWGHRRGRRPRTRAWAHDIGERFSLPRPASRTRTQRNLSAVPVPLTLVRKVRGQLQRSLCHGIARRFGVDAIVTDRLRRRQPRPVRVAQPRVHVGDDPETTFARIVVASPRRRVSNRGRLVIARSGPRRPDVVDARTGHARELATSSSLRETTSPSPSGRRLRADAARGRATRLDSPSCTRVGGASERDVARERRRTFIDPASVHAFSGPCISGERYQVGPEVADHFTHLPRRSSTPTAVIAPARPATRRRARLLGGTGSPTTQHRRFGMQSTDGGGRSSATARRVPADASPSSHESVVA